MKRVFVGRDLDLRVRIHQLILQADYPDILEVKRAFLVKGSNSEIRS
jgi:hypothetical protein